jgi:hypothetical protein
MVSRRPVRTHRSDAEGSQADRRERLPEQEVNQNEDGGENVVLPPPPPPIYTVDLVKLRLPVLLFTLWINLSMMIGKFISPITALER